MSLVQSQALSLDKAEKLQKLILAIPEILASTKNPEYDEIYGYRIGPNGTEHVNEEVRNEILLKFLIATEYDLEAAKKKIAASLNWRRTFQVLKAAYEEEYDPELEKLGVITDYENNKDNFRVVTWNLYANLKNPKKLFAKFGIGVEDTKSKLPGTMFLRWRVGLMERSLLLLDFSSDQNCKIAQVHDYNNVSMFRMDPGMRTATKEIITVFSDNYPELLSKKFFINVPLLMGWVFAFFKATGLISAATLKKFEMLNHGDLSEVFGKDNLPKEYNGGSSNKVASIFDTAVPAERVTAPEYVQIIMKKFEGKYDDVKEVKVTKNEVELKEEAEQKEEPQEQKVTEENLKTLEDEAKSID